MSCTVTLRRTVRNESFSLCRNTTSPARVGKTAREKADGMLAGDKIALESPIFQPDCQNFTHSISFVARVAGHGFLGPPDFLALVRMLLHERAARSQSEKAWDAEGQSMLYGNNICKSSKLRILPERSRRRLPARGAAASGTRGTPCAHPPTRGRSRGRGRRKGAASLTAYAHRRRSLRAKAGRAPCLCRTQLCGRMPPANITNA